MWARVQRTKEKETPILYSVEKNYIFFLVLKTEKKKKLKKTRNIFKGAHGHAHEKIKIKNKNKNNR